ncbi:MAG: peptidoglycan DD-metalloendopeptidase family protein [Pseudobdellovibrio sp.]
MTLLSVTILSTLTFALYQKNQKAEQQDILKKATTVFEKPVLPIEQRYPFTIPSRSTLSAELSKSNIDSATVHALVEAAKPYRDLAKINPQTRFQIFYSETDPTDFIGIKFRFTPRESLHLKKINNTWTAEAINKPVQTKVVTFKGEVKNSLWLSAEEAQMPPLLIADLAEIFAWQVDFSREVQVGDRWRLSVEQEFVNGEPIGWGAILSAEYINNKDTHTAVLFRRGDEDLGYFKPDGSSLKRMFLKSPIAYGRISSRFQKNRFHPVLKTARAHLGVDYAAPTGTPIRSVGDGVITLSGWSGGGGNVVKIRHNGTYETAYKHLSRYASGIKKGSTVKQGQIIGFVGSTGLSTGPHLHFEFFVNGRYVDPLGQKFPTADPVPSNYLAEFSQNRDNFINQLPEWEHVKY